MDSHQQGKFMNIALVKKIDTNSTNYNNYHYEGLFYFSHLQYTFGH
jgi:hypothetical protein